jgi:hypothetical protein
MKDLNARLKTVELLQGRLGKTLEHTDISNNLLNRTPIAQQERGRIDQWGCMKLNALHSKVNGHKMEDTTFRWEKISKSYISDKRLITRVYREPPKN